MRQLPKITSLCVGRIIASKAERLSSFFNEKKDPSKALANLHISFTKEVEEEEEEEEWRWKKSKKERMK